MKPLVINLLKRLTVDLLAWMRELCAALEDSLLAPRNHSPGTHVTLMDVDGQMSFISLMCKMVSVNTNYRLHAILVRALVNYCVMVSHFQVSGRPLNSKERGLLPVLAFRSPSWTSTGQSCLEGHNLTIGLMMSMCLTSGTW